MTRAVRVHKVGGPEALIYEAVDVPAPGAGSFTPARRALERPMAIACFGERAPCLPSRT